MDWQLPEKKKFPAGSIYDVEDAKKAVAPLNLNLDNFQRVPRGSNGKAKLTGVALFFSHMFVSQHHVGEEGCSYIFRFKSS